MAQRLVLREDREGVAYLTLNRPDKLNALTVAVFRDLASHITLLEGQVEEIGCVILRGAGKCFSAGHDLADLEEGEALPEPDYQAKIISALSALPQPVICAVHGHCYTGALELALGGDMIFASESAKFADTHAKWGLSPIWGLSQRLRRRIGVAKAHEMMMSCATYPGREAAAMGLANQCYPDTEFEDRLHEFATGILTNSWYALQGNKRLIRDGEDMSLDAGLAYEITNTPGVAPDSEERIRAFTQKNKNKTG